MRLYEDFATGLTLRGPADLTARSSAIDANLDASHSANALQWSGWTFERAVDDTATLRMDGGDGPQEQGAGTNDTVPGNASTTFVLSIGGSQSGRINTAGDDDWYRVTLVAGETYLFTMTGSGGSPLIDPYLELRNATGGLIAIDDDAGPGTSSSLRFTVTQSGTYYINARAWEADTGATLTGDYTLSVVAGAAPQNPLDTLDIGYEFPDNTINVYFATTGQTFLGDTSLRSWTQAEIDAVMAALDTFEAVTPLVFTQVMSSASADFVLVLADLSDNVLGHFHVGAGVGCFAPDTTTWLAGLAAGSSAWTTVIHEIGHGLGLAHPHDNGGDSEIMQGVIGPFSSYGTFQLNQGVFTTMSYNDGWQFAPGGPNGSLTTGSQSTPMALDIGMLQLLYGANTTYNNGDNTYTLTAAAGSYIAIWDTGGADSIVFSGTQAATIDLRAATLLNEVGGGGFVSYVTGFHNGFTIANGVVIENATGGSGNDTLIGNGANNLLIGNAGTDSLTGGDGHDTLIGGAGGDALIGGNGTDTASYAGAAGGVTADLQTGANTGEAAGDSFNSIENLIGSSFNDTLRGDANNNQLIGGDGNDTLEGRDGHDQLIGGAGADAHVGGAGFDYARYETASAGVAADLINGGSAGDAQGDTFSGVEGLIGSSFNDTLAGDDGVNDMHGNDGADWMEGRGGDDALIGGAGHDHLIGGLGADILDGGDGFDYARYDNAAAGLTADLADTFGTTGEGLGDVFTSIEGVVGSAFDDVLKGDANPNDIHGQNGNDSLYGRGHDDYLGGGAGHDHLYGGTGADILDGGEGFDYARYDEAAAGLTADLMDTFGTTGEGLGDVFISIEGVVGSAFNDVLKGDDNANDIHGGAGNDSLYGRGHDDYLGGGAGHDHLYGGTGADILDGGEGFDYARYDEAAAGLTADLMDTFGTTGEGLGDVFISIEGMVGSAFDDVLKGDNAANDMHGQNGNDTLEGRGGGDNLGGEDGNDTLDGGAGADTLTGGAGDDTFVFQAGQAQGDAILDFDGNGAAAGDAIVFSGYGTAAEGASFIQLDATHWQITSADGLIVEVITLSNGATIDASDYIFGGG